MARKISKRSRFHFRKITPIPKLLSFVLLLCSIWNGFLSSLPHFSPLHGTFLTECRAIFALSSSFYSCLFPSTYLSLSSLFYRVYRHNGFGSALTVPMHVCTIGRNSLKLHFALTCKSSHRYSSNRYPKSCMSPCVQSSEGSRSLSLSRHCPSELGLCQAKGACELFLAAPDVFFKEHVCTVLCGQMGCGPCGTGYREKLSSSQVRQSNQLLLSYPPFPVRHPIWPRSTLRGKEPKRPNVPRKRERGRARVRTGG